ncbi:class I glutamine amidotransferase-like protein [Zopfia rhizophila CBS 207.26]|uniref:Class I glutamine amidotransferase-like protein n=1 Tax=Zopfia rhizophila CBS 207.26 TaxID=1314779 RepID=A0A6A6E0E1_9PEZI|nr:class I glutamine amidotransferase-like protein [Zopfia rhizophila CBS 207.26]
MSSTPRAYTHLPSQADLFYFCTTLSTSEEDLNIHYAPPSKSSLKIGVLLLGQDEIQLLDLAPVDMLAMISRDRISRLNTPERALDEVVDELDIRYVSESGEGTFRLTSGARVPVTNSFENAPQFDIILIPGSFSSAELSLSASTFITTQTSSPNLIAIMTISSGILALAQTGFLHERRATAPSSLLPNLRQRFPQTSWQETRWSRHGNIWSSSSAITAMDMMSAWMREYFWDRSEAAEWALNATGVARLEEYDG